MLLLKVVRQVVQAVQPMVRKVEVRMKAWTKPASDSFIGGTAVDLVKSKPELIVENAFLRQQLIIVTRQAKQPKLTPRDRGLLVLLASRVREWKNALLIVKPEYPDEKAGEGSGRSPGGSQAKVVRTLVNEVC